MNTETQTRILLGVTKDGLKVERASTNKIFVNNMSLPLTPTGIIHTFVKNVDDFGKEKISRRIYIEGEDETFDCASYRNYEHSKKGDIHLYAYPNQRKLGVYQVITDGHTDPRDTFRSFGESGQLARFSGINTECLSYLFFNMHYGKEELKDIYKKTHDLFEEENKRIFNKYFK